MIDHRSGSGILPLSSVVGGLAGPVLRIGLSLGFRSCGSPWPVILHTLLISVRHAPMLRCIELSAREIKDRCAAMRAVCSPPKTIIDYLMAVPAMPFYNLVKGKFRAPLRRLELWLAWDIGRRDVCRGQCIEHITPLIYSFYRRMVDYLHLLSANIGQIQPALSAAISEEPC